MDLTRIFLVLLPGFMASSFGARLGIEVSRNHVPRVHSSGGFSISVTEKNYRQRDFVRDWISAHQKWGGDVPDDVYTTFSLADSGKS